MFKVCRFFMIPFFNLRAVNKNILKRTSASKISPSLCSLLEIYLIASSFKKGIYLGIPESIVIYTIGWTV